MVNCPICGVENQEGSRFCSACGAVLPTRTGIRCPMCGQMNPLGNVFCDHCNARLVPLTSPPPPEESPKEEPPPPSIKPFSLPTISLGEKEEEGDWLASLRTGIDEGAGEAQAELPDWLKGEEPEVGLPDWLAGAEEEKPAGVPEWLAGAEEEQPAAPAFAAPPDWLKAEEPAEEIGLPDWLAGAEEEKPAAPTGETFDRAVLSGLPDWLVEAPGGPAEPPRVPAFETGVEGLDWQAPQEPFAIPEAEPSPLSGLPDWLIGAETAAPAGQEPPTEPLFPPVQETAGLPDWLTAAGPPPPTAKEEVSLDWLADLEEVETRAAPTLPSVAPPPEAEGLVRGEIPAWLEALRPKTEAETAAEEPPEAAGLLEGLRGTLAPSHIVDMPKDARLIAPSAPTAAAIARSDLLKELLSRPAAPPLEIKEERGRRLALPLRIGISLALLAAILIPMFLPIPLFSAPSMPAAENLFEVIEQQIAPDSPVLVAFEYGPADADEMDWVAAAILRHLLQRGDRLIVVSTRPEGTATAERVLSRLLPEAAARETYAANLGYQPGQVAGIQSLLADLQSRVEVRSGLPAAETAAMAGVASAGDTKAVLILAAQSDDLRYWIEQASATCPDVPLLAGISARAETTSLPYLAPQARQLQGAVVGIVGAGAYEQRLGGGEQGNYARFYLPSLGAAQLAVLAILIVGMLVYILQPGGRKR